MSTPDIDILLVTYNHEPFISKALEGIGYQEYPGRLHIVVADDNSSDETLGIIKEYARRNSEFDWTFLPITHNLGITKNYERGFASCQADYVAVLEGDDFWTNTQKLFKQVTFLHTHTECVACASNYHIYDQKHLSYRLRHATTDGVRFLTSRMLIEDNAIGNFSACVYRTRVLRALPAAVFTVTAYDWAINICVGMQGLIGLLGEPLSAYRIHDRGAWNEMSPDEKLKAQLRLIPIYDDITQGMFSSEFKMLSATICSMLDHSQALPPDIKNRFLLTFRSTALATCPPILLPFFRRVSRALRAR